MRLPRIMIVDDHLLFAEGLAHVLQDRFEIVATMTDGRLLTDAVRRLKPDVLLLDVSMPHISGLDVLRQLKAERLSCRTIMLTMHADPRMAAEALGAGASGFLLKEASREELVTALDAVLQGQTYLTAALTREVLSLMAGPVDPDHIDLTPRQREVLRLIVQGQRVKEIAAMLDLSPRSVESIKYRMMQDLNVQSTAGLVRYAIEHNIVGP